MRTRKRSDNEAAREPASVTGNQPSSKIDVFLNRIISMERHLEKNNRSKGLMMFGGVMFFLVALVVFLVFQAKMF